MKKLLIVGHPSSDLLEVEKLLNERGMAKALPSHRERMAPVEVGSTLLKAHATQRVSVSERAVLSAGHALQPYQSRYAQLDVAPVWNGLAMDLMLGNLDQPLWGWADPDAIQLLDYWQKLDPEMAFVLVYDAPVNFLMRRGTEQSELTTTQLQKLMQQWVGYHSALLQFHKRYGDRTLLVHAGQVRVSADRYLQQMRAHLLTPLHGADADEDTTRGAAGAPINATFPIASSQVDDREGEPTSGHENARLREYVASNLLAQHPEVNAMWEELQAAADLPEQGEHKHAPSALDAWRDLGERERNSKELQARLLEQKQRAAAHALEQQTQLNLTKQQQAAQSRQLSVVQQELDQAKQNADALQTDQVLLMAQLTKVQEGLELAAQDKQENLRRIQQQNAKLDTAGRDLDDARKQVNELETQAKQHTAKLLAAQRELDESRKELEELHKEKQKQQADTTQKLFEAAHHADELNKDNALLLEQLTKVQVELERRHLLEQQEKHLAANPQMYGAANRVRGHLSFRLGAVMIQRSKSVTGWLGMPLALRREAKAFHAERLQRQSQKLPPVTSYADAAEADKVRSTLSYRLGSTLLRDIRSPLGWMRMPLSMCGEVIAFKKS